MNKKIMSGILAVSMLLTGCSGISQSDYDSLVSENSDLKAKNEQLNATYDAQSKKYNALESDYEKLESDYAALESDTESSEYCMPKDHVKRVAKVLSLSDDLIEPEHITMNVEQYNLKSECIISGYNEQKQCKIIINIKTDNTSQEMAAFLTYRLRIGLEDYVEKEIKNGCENVVFVVNDVNGETIAVWLVYDNNGQIEHDMDVVNADVLKAVDEVLADDKWVLKEPETNEPFSSPDTENQSDYDSHELEELREQYKYSYISEHNYGKCYIESTGHTGYAKDTLKSWFVFYIDDFKELDDKQMIDCAYIDMLSSAIEYPGEIFYSFFLATQDGDTVATGFFTIYDEQLFGIPITWSGEYSRLNDNETNRFWAEQTLNYQQE